MTIALAPNLIPPGTRPGSPVKIVDVHVDEGHNTLSTSLPLSDLAEENDLVLAWFATGGDSTHFGALTGQSPEGFFQYLGSFIGAAGIDNQVEITLLMHRVAAGEPGGSVGLSWSFGGADVSWELVVATFRYADADNPLTSFGTARSDANGTYLGGITPEVPGSLIFAAMGFAQATGSGWVAPNTYGALSPDEQGKGGQSTQSPDGWYGVDGKPGNVGGSYGLVPNLGLVTGVIDMPVPYPLGTGTGYSTFLAWVAFGTPSGSTANGSGVSMSCAINPMPQPGPIGFDLGIVGGYLDVESRPVVADWTGRYVPRAGQGPQVGWLFAREHPDGTGRGFWNADLNVWEADQYVNFGNVTKYVWPDGAWVNDGSSWLAYMAVEEGQLNYLSVLSWPLGFVARADPKVTVTQPGGNLATGTASVGWLVDWAGGTPYAFQVRICSSDQYLADGFDPGASACRSESGTVVSSVGTWTTPAALRGGGYYRAFVRVQGSAGGPWSAWESIDFFVTAGALATPVVTAVAGLDPATSCPRAEIDVQCADTSDWSGTTYVNVFRYDPVAQTMVPLRFGQDVPVPWPSQAVALYDYEMGPNEPAIYQAEVYSTKTLPTFTLDDPTYGLLDTAADILS